MALAVTDHVMQRPSQRGRIPVRLQAGHGPPALSGGYILGFQEGDTSSSITLWHTNLEAKNHIFLQVKHYE